MKKRLKARKAYAGSHCLHRLVRWFCDVRDIRACKEILWSELDRDRDESDSLRALVVIAVNALHRERQSSKVAAHEIKTTEQITINPPINSERPPVESAELSDLRDAKKRYEAAFVRIAKAHGIASPVMLIAMAENDDENYAEILARYIEQSVANASEML